MRQILAAILVVVFALAKLTSIGLWFNSHEGECSHAEMHFCTTDQHTITSLWYSFSSGPIQINKSFTADQNIQLVERLPLNNRLDASSLKSSLKNRAPPLV